MQWCRLLTATAFVVLLIAGNALSQPRLEPPADPVCRSLIGLPGVYVHVTTLAPLGLDGELAPETLKDFIETRLREAGVRLLARDELREVPGAPILDVQLCLLRHETVNLYQYSVETLLWERVALARERELITQAITWRSGVKFANVMGELLPGRIREVLDAQLGRLVSDLRRANAGDVPPAQSVPPVVPPAEQPPELPAEQPPVLPPPTEEPAPPVAEETDADALIVVPDDVQEPAPPAIPPPADVEPPIIEVPVEDDAEAPLPEEPFDSLIPDEDAAEDGELP